LTTESSSQTTPSFTPTLPSQGSSCAAKECTNDTGCCVPHVERRCHHQNRTRVSSQTCKAIVIGEDNNNSFVIAIVINDKEVLVINSNHFFLLLLSMAITVLLLLLIKTCFVIVIYRKKIAITFRLWYLSVKKYSTESQRKQWEKC
jgi:positive regulator of sigma E activity